ncbi:MAG: YdcF family protein [Labilithrix sp.]|nr:YdcF family protein [Labilithrix sp.]MCW5811263.1 YdcF family protein [Labilithrix sp.]
MFYALSKVLDVFLCPYTWGVLLLAAATPWTVRGAKRFRRRRAYGVAGLLVLVVSGMAPVPNAIMWRLERSAPSTYRAYATYDAVILLGGLVDEVSTAENGVPAYNDSVERLTTTYRLLREDKARFVVVSAGTNPELPAYGEAAVVARQLAEWGIAKERIIVEDKARNTRENALNTQAIAKERGFADVLVVTSAFHMARAAECFAAIGMAVDTLAVDYRAHARSGRDARDWIPRVDGLSDTSGTLHEVFGRLVYRLRGYGKV